MKKTILVLSLPVFLTVVAWTLNGPASSSDYKTIYHTRLEKLSQHQTELYELINKQDFNLVKARDKIKEQIAFVRMSLKKADFWLRYLEPISYKKINGPLPVEWETEVFEKWEKPYKREGAGLTLLSLYLDEDKPEKDSALKLLKIATDALALFAADSIVSSLRSFDHFYYCNRLSLLNLATIYTSGFECPETDRIIPELRTMLSTQQAVYEAFNSEFPEQALSKEYKELFGRTVFFVQDQPGDFEQFDHFTFVREYINPLYRLNHDLIRKHKPVSKNMVDYSLNKNASTIFSKNLYNAQNPKGVYLRVYDKNVIKEIEAVGKLLFFDPILSGNNKRSCASCHKPDMAFTDTSKRTATHFNLAENLSRNTPSLLNADFNHLIMMDGKHLSLQDQTHAVITNSQEMGCNENEILKKVLSCRDYKQTFTTLLQHTPLEKEITLSHLFSAITMYYSKFSKTDAPFDDYMNGHAKATADVQKGYNLFMGKAQCGTCHFAPQFNGVKPPYVGSEFEVLGVPADTAYKSLSIDQGRFIINPAIETDYAFRTGTLRNSMKTAPYMHNGVFRNMDQVIEFYNGGGGAGRNLLVPNQTLSSDSLHLNTEEKRLLTAFLTSLNEPVPAEKAPERLPLSKYKNLNKRKPGGEY